MIPPGPRKVKVVNNLYKYLWLILIGVLRFGSVGKNCIRWIAANIFTDWTTLPRLEYFLGERWQHRCHLCHSLPVCIICDLYVGLLSTSVFGSIFSLALYARGVWCVELTVCIPVLWCLWFYSVYFSSTSIFRWWSTFVISNRVHKNHVCSAFRLFVFHSSGLAVIFQTIFLCCCVKFLVLITFVCKPNTLTRNNYICFPKCCWYYNLVLACVYNHISTSIFKRQTCSRNKR